MNKIFACDEDTMLECLKMTFPEIDAVECRLSFADWATRIRTSDYPESVKTGALMLMFACQLSGEGQRALEPYRALTALLLRARFMDLQGGA